VFAALYPTSMDQRNSVRRSYCSRSVFVAKRPLFRGLHQSNL